MLSLEVNENLCFRIKLTVLTIVIKAKLFVKKLATYSTIFVNYFYFSILKLGVPLTSTQTHRKNMLVTDRMLVLVKYDFNASPC